MYKSKYHSVLRIYNIYLELENIVQIYIRPIMFY